MKLNNLSANAQHRLNQLGLALATTVAGIGAAMADDPSTEIVAAISTGKGYGIAAATAFVVACWAITAVYMAKRKG
jgi:hypothetical protein